MDKNKYKLVDCNDPLGIPVEWTKIESNTFDAIPSDRLYNRLAVSSSTGDIVTRTVIYLKKVDKLPKTIKKVFEEDKIIIGIPD